MSGAPRVLHVSPGLGVRGGISRVVANYLASPLASRCRLSHVASHCDGPRALKLLAALGGLTRMLPPLIFRRVDLVHLHCGDAPSPCRKFVFQCVARAFGVPSVVHCHTALFMEQYERLPGWRRAMARALLSRAARVVCLSPQWRGRLLSVAPGARIEVLPNAVPLPPAPASGSAPDGPLRISFLGSIDQRKGVFTLLEAFAALRREHPDAELHVCGAGDVAGLERAAGERGLAGAVVTHGWLRGAELGAVLDRTDVLALPSRGEGLPMSLLEAMALGIAVVATPVGGVPELVRDGENGLLVPVGDAGALAAALGRLADDAALRRALGAAGARTVADEFSMAATVERLDALYRELLSKGAP